MRSTKKLWRVEESSYHSYSTYLLEIQKGSCFVQYSPTYLVHKPQLPPSAFQGNTYLLLKNQTDKDQDLH